MIIKQRKCTSCSFTFAIPEEVSEAVCPRCGEKTADPSLESTPEDATSPPLAEPSDPVLPPLPQPPAPVSASMPGSTVPDLPAPLPPLPEKSPIPPDPLAPQSIPAVEVGAIHEPSFSPPEETPSSEPKPALGRITLKKKALPKAGGGVGRKADKKSRYDDSAIRGQSAKISPGPPLVRENAISLTEALKGEESPNLPPAEAMASDVGEDLDYVDMECEPLEVGDLVVMDNGVMVEGVEGVEDEVVEDLVQIDGRGDDWGERASGRQRNLTPPPPLPGAPQLPLPKAEDFDWQPLPVGFQPPPLAEEYESPSSNDYDLQPSSSASAELEQPEPYSTLQPLSLDQAEPIGYEERFHQAAAGSSPADSLTPLPVFETAMETVPKPVASTPGIKVLVPLMPVEEVQLGGKRPAPAPAPVPASPQNLSPPPADDAPSAHNHRAQQGAKKPKVSTGGSKDKATKEKTQKKRKRWWPF